MKPPFKYRLACRILELTRHLSFKSAWKLSGLLRIIMSGSKGRLLTTIRNNIQKVFPDKTPQEQEQLIQSTLRHTLAFGLEAGCVWMKPLEYGIEAITEIRGIEHLEQAQASGRGVLILLPHLGNWEMANQFIAPRAEVVALYKPHPNKQLEHYIYNARCRAGVTMVPTNKSGVVQIVRHLKAGGVTVILPDQVPDTNGGVVAPFFNHPALTPTLAPKLAKSSKAIILGLVCARDRKGGFVVSITRAPDTIADADPAVAAQSMNQFIEERVLEHPDQYQWGYKRYKNVPLQSS